LLRVMVSAEQVGERLRTTQAASTLTLDSK
jgi:hypothetical protein